MFHQGYTSAEEAAIVSGFSEISEREGFVVVYPHGERGYWNVDESNPAIPNALDDLGFVEALIAWLRAQLQIRHDMIYSAGICIGEAFSHKIAAERSDLIAAIGVVAGAMKPATFEKFAPEHPVSVIKFHGQSDFIVPWDGEADYVLSSEDTVWTWAEHDGCPRTPIEEQLPDVDASDGCRAWRKTFGPGRFGTEAVLYGIEGGGHNWPGQRQDDNPYTTGKICRDVSASEEIWAFFEAHPKRHAQDMLFSIARLEAAAAYSRDCGGSAVLVMTDGQVVFEDYHNGATPDTATHIASATKGFWASALAAALEDGLIDSVGEQAVETINEWLDTNRHPGKPDITVTHLATLCSGLSQDVDQIQGLDAQAFDIYQYVVDQLRILRPPGEWFQYGPSHYYAFGVVLSRKLADQGMNPDPLSYLEDRILDRIGVAYDDWERDGAGNPHIPNGCYITPRNWIKYGQFLLQRGTWNGVSIVDEALMEAVFDLRGPNPGHAGFLWTNGPGGYGATPDQTTPDGAAGGFLYHDGYTELLGALGAGKNRIYLLPRLNSVVLRQTTGDTANFVDHEFLARLLPQTVARDDAVTTVTGTPIIVDLLANDVDADWGRLTVSSITQPANGHVSLHADYVSYVPASGFTGVDRFAYTVEDEDGHTDSGDVTVTVSAAENPGITHQPSDRWVTHVTSAAGGFNTRVLMTNFGELPAQLTLQPCTLGGQAEQPVLVNIGPARSLAVDAADLFADMSASHFSIVGPKGSVVTAAYRAAQGAGASASAHVTESAATATGFLIYPAEQDLVFDGCALVNTGSGTAKIQLTLQDADGGVIVTDVLHEGLSPHAKLLHILDGYDLNGIATATITSDQPLSALFLRGSRPGVEPAFLFQVMPITLSP